MQIATGCIGVGLSDLQHPCKAADVRTVKVQLHAPCLSSSPSFKVNTFSALRVCYLTRCATRSGYSRVHRQKNLIPSFRETFSRNAAIRRNKVDGRPQLSRNIKILHRGGSILLQLRAGIAFVPMDLRSPSTLHGSDRASEDYWIAFKDRDVQCWKL